MFRTVGAATCCYVPAVLLYHLTSNPNAASIRREGFSSTACFVGSANGAPTTVPAGTRANPECWVIVDMHDDEAKKYLGEPMADVYRLPVNIANERRDCFRCERFGLPGWPCPEDSQ